MFLLKRRSTKHARASSWGGLLDKPKLVAPPAPVPEIPRLEGEPPCIPELGLLARRNSISGETATTSPLPTESREDTQPRQPEQAKEQARSQEAERQTQPSTPAGSTPAAQRSSASTPRATPATPAPTPARPCTPRSSSTSGSGSKAPQAQASSSKAPQPQAAAPAHPQGPSPHYMKARSSISDDSRPTTPFRPAPTPSPAVPSAVSRAKTLRKSLLPPRRGSRAAEALPERKLKESISGPTLVPGKAPSIASVELPRALIKASPPSRRPSLPSEGGDARPPDRPDPVPAATAPVSAPAKKSVPATRRPPLSKEPSYTLTSSSSSDFQRTMERLSLSAVASGHTGDLATRTPALRRSRRPSVPPPTSFPVIRSHPPLLPAAPIGTSGASAFSTDSVVGVSYQARTTLYANPRPAPPIPSARSAEALTRSTSAGSSDSATSANSAGSRASGVPSLSSSLDSGLSASDSDSELEDLVPRRSISSAIDADLPFNTLLLMHPPKPGRKPVPRAVRSLDSEVSGLHRRMSVAGAPPVPPRRREVWRSDLLRIVRGFDELATAREERDAVRKVGDPGLGEREALNVVRMFVDEIHARARLGEREREGGAAGLVGATVDTS